MSETPAEPDGIGIDITESGHVVLRFDHGDIPPIKLSLAGAEQTGSHIANAVHRARFPEKYGGDE